MNFYDREGNPMTLREWASFFELDGYKIVERTDIDDEVWVSTIWVGIDRSYGDGPPSGLFETVVFGGEFDDIEIRYTTEGEARTGHEQTCQFVRAAMGAR